jgi:hypothetical protein
MIAIPPLKLRRTAALAVAALLACASAASAWQDLGDDPLPPVPSPATTWFTLPVRVGFFVALLIVAWAFWFYAFYPWMLDRKNAMRPLRAYGLAAALIWVTWCGSALLIFGDMLVLKSSNFEGSGAAGFLRDWLMTCLICLAAIIGFAMLRMIFGGRSATAEA